MSTWLAIAVLLVTVTALVITSIVSLTYGEALAGDLVDVQLEARAATKADEMRRYLWSMQDRTAALATSPGVAELSDLFSDAYAELGTLDTEIIEEASVPVAAFYQDQFAPALADATGSPVPWRTLLPVGDEALYLQRHYVVPSEGTALEPDLIDDAADGSTWSAVHQQFHLWLLEIAMRLRAADIYLVEPTNGNIVYSVAKKPDFATSLDLGPYGGSTLAAAVRAAREEPERGVVTMLDMAPHAPDLGAPMLFMASPVFDGSELAAILVLKIPVERIDEIMTSEQNWVAEGLGETGETFLVASDGRMRSAARSFLENPGEFVRELEDAGTVNAQERSLIAGTGTTAVFLKVADGSEVAAAGESNGGVIDRTNYLLQPVATAVEPLDVSGLEWLVVAETEREEIDAPINGFRRALLIAVAVFVIMITFATVAWSRAVFAPVRAISDRLQKIHDGEDPEEIEPDKRAPTDYVELSDNIDEMLASLRRRETELAAAAADRLGTLRSLLPAAIAERVEAGDRNVIDRIPQAAIVVLVIDGMGEVVRRHDADRVQGLLGRLVDEIDSLARHHGLGRVKLVGDTYFAGCGLAQPYLDSAPRAVAFAMEAQDVVRELSVGYQVQPGLATGIHSGPVTVGLTGSARLVYDLWGETVNTAVFLARTARPGEILVTDTVKDLLPTDVAAARTSESADTAPVWQVTGHVTSRGTSP